MSATRLAVRTISALTCVIFLLGFTGCSLDSNIDKTKEDAYKQGYEQGLKDSSANQDSNVSTFSPSRELPTFGVPNRELPIPGKSYPSGLTPSEKVPYEMPEDFNISTTPEDDPNYTQQLEDKIRQLELELEFERFDSESERIQREAELWYYKNQLKNQ